MFSQLVSCQRDSYNVSLQICAVREWFAQQRHVPFNLLAQVASLVVSALFSAAQLASACKSRCPVKDDQIANEHGLLLLAQIVWLVVSLCLCVCLLANLHAHRHDSLQCKLTFCACWLKLHGWWQVFVCVHACCPSGCACK